MLMSEAEVMSQQEYVASGAERCPFCRSSDITFFRSQENAGFVDEQFECAECGRAFHRKLSVHGWSAGP